MILQSGVLALGAWLVINQQATAGVMLAATILSIRALAPIELAIANWRGFIACRASFQRLSESFQATPPKPSSLHCRCRARQLRVAALSLTAPRSEIVVLHDVSFALQAGSALAIVGPSGSGKSTLARAPDRRRRAGARRDPDRRRRAGTVDPLALGPRSDTCRRMSSCSAAPWRKTFRASPRTRTPTG